MIERLDDGDWNLLLRRIWSGECTPFLGAGACADVLPLGKDIAYQWAGEHGYPMEDSGDLARVSQYMTLKYDAIMPRGEIVDIIKASPGPDFSNPDEPHDFLATLPLPLYMTTNYDDFMLRALRKRHKEPIRELCRWNKGIKNYPSQFDNEAGFTPTVDKPVVFHLHGHQEEPESMVLTEDDYLDFLVNTSGDQKIVPPRVQQALTGASLLFIGYSLSDWSFRVLYRGLVANKGRNSRYVSVTVQLPPPPAGEEAEKAERQVQYLTKYFNSNGMRVYWGDAKQFVAELRQRWDQFVKNKTQTQTQLQPIVSVSSTPEPKTEVPTQAAVSAETVSETSAKVETSTETALKAPTVSPSETSEKPSESSTETALKSPVEASAKSEAPTETDSPKHKTDTQTHPAIQVAPDGDE